MQIKDVRSARTFLCEGCGADVPSGTTYIRLVTVQPKNTAVVRRLCVVCGVRLGYWDAVHNRAVYSHFFSKRRDRKS